VIKIRIKCGYCGKTHKLEGDYFIDDTYIECSCGANITTENWRFPNGKWVFKINCDVEMEDDE